MSFSIDFVIEQTAHTLAVSTSEDPASDTSVRGPAPTFVAGPVTSTSQLEVNAGVSVSVRLRPSHL